MSIRMAVTRSMHQSFFTRTATGKFLLGVLLVFSCGTQAHAQNDERPDGWSGTATLGATQSSGNTESSNVQGSLRLTRKAEIWEHLLFASVFKASSTIVVVETDQNGDPVLNAEGEEVRNRVDNEDSDRLVVGYQPKYFYTPKSYLFAVLDWERDRPGNIDSATRQVVGAGHRFFDNDLGSLSAELGIGNKTTDLVNGNDVDGAIAYLGVNYLNRFSDILSFAADLRSDFGSDNRFLELGLGLNFKISDALSLKLAHSSRYNSNLSALDNLDSSERDSVTSINLVLDI